MNRRLIRPSNGAIAIAIAIAIATAIAVLDPTVAEATDVSRTALAIGSQPKPNVIFGMDNSTSMDTEVLLSGTNDGAFWWDANTSVQSGWVNGVPIFGGGKPKYSYLFPNGCVPAQGRQVACPGNADQNYGIAPTPQMAAMRSANYNPIFYDPLKTYLPWAPATLSNTLTTYPASNPSAALTDPLYTVTFPLDTNMSVADINTTFHMLYGMKVPAGTQLYDPVAARWVVVNSDFVVSPKPDRDSPIPAPPTTPAMSVAAASYEAAFVYYPATYWVRQACTDNNLDCTTAPDGATLKRYQIKTGVTFPSGRGYADEMQNFSNWFTYYRKRRLMLAGSMGKVMSTLTGMRVGLVKFNGSGTVTMYDTDSTDTRANGRVISGTFYQNDSNGGTPTRDTLKFIGEQFRNNTTVIQSSCQRNAAVIVTDGFASPSDTTPPAYTSGTYGAAAPYTTTWPMTLADIALSYYTINVRPDLPVGNVPVAARGDTNPASDRNPNLHMNTYAITLGPMGNIWPARTDPYASPAIAWPNPTDNTSPMSIDDLWHATINGRGTMLGATNPTDTAASVQAALGNIMQATGAQSAVAFSNATLKLGDSTVFKGIYRPVDWTGDVTAVMADPATGATGSTLWSADSVLRAATWTGRAIFSYDGSSGVAFTSSLVGARVNPGSAYGSSSALVDYLRGDRSREGSTYRARNGLLGGVINAQPVVDKAQGVVYGTTNEGMVHAFDIATGRERWAYVPGFTHAGIGAQSQPNWTFQTLLDGTPAVGTAGSRRLLFGGAGTAGPGFYALDVTTVGTAPTEAQLAGRVLWEFPNATSVSTLSTNTQVRAEVGTSVGTPLLVQSHALGWVVLVTSGYNSTGDGKGRLFALDALTGAIKAELATTAGSTGSGDAGLAQLSARSEPDGTARYVYGGDLLGNLWRFDLDTSSVMKLATLTSASGTPLPMTARPELSSINGRHLVFVGTGRLLGATDLTDTGVNDMVGIWDNNTALTNPRQQLAVRVPSADGSTLVGDPVNWATQRGWMIDLPAGEKADTDPKIAAGVLGWTTNRPSSVSCTATSSSYTIDAASGMGLASSMFLDGGASIVKTKGGSSGIEFAQTSSGTLAAMAQLSDGTLVRRETRLTGGISPRKSVWREIRR